MKKILLVLFFALACHGYAQLLFTEDFTGYTIGNLDGQNGWTQNGTGPIHATIANTTPLTYTNYNGGGAEYLSFAANNSTSSRVFKNFTTSVSATTPGTTVYYSILLNLNTTFTTATGYFFSLTDTGAVGNYFAKMFAKQVSATTYQLGISKSSNTAAFSSQILNTNQTYLVVVRYDIHNTATAQSGNEVFMWIDPVLSAMPSTASCDASVLAGATQSDYSTLFVGGVSWFNRGVNNPYGAIDGIRVAAGTDSVSAWKALAAYNAPKVNVTFQVNMAVQMKKGKFVAGKDSLVIRGDLQVDAGDVGNWGGNNLKLTAATASDSIYKITLALPASRIDSTYNYKFVIDDATWENDPNRTFVLKASDMTLPAVYFNRDSVYIAPTSTVKVTFEANMAVQIKRGTFVPASDSIVVRGDWQADANDPAGNWAGNTFKLLPATASDSIYKVTVTFSNSLVGHAYNYKFVKDNGTWESNDNRPFTLAATDMVLYPFYFNNDSIFVPQKSVTATVTFYADIRSIWGSGDGYFDESQDSLLIEGLGSWDSKGTILSGTSRLELINPTSTGVYSTTIVIKGFAGDSTSYKYEAFPSTRFANTGWETGTNRYFHFPYSDSTFNMPYIIPAITPSVTLANDVTVLFSLHFADTSKNAKNGQLIPHDKIAWTAVKGSVAQLGNWGGNWTAADTAVAAGSTYPTLILMNDKGVDGDAVPGDGIWSKKITFAAGSQGGLVEFKYTCMYPGADTVNGGTTPMDNEYAFQLNHQFMLINPKVGNQINLGDLWGLMGTADVKTNPLGKNVKLTFTLDQNYPNPFNPSTKIKFMIPQDGQVIMKVYDILGKEVTTLVDQHMKAGSYETNFNASQFSTGVYIYRLSVGNYTAVKKMMLIK